MFTILKAIWSVIRRLWRRKSIKLEKKNTQLMTKLTTGKAVQDKRRDKTTFRQLVSMTLCPKTIDSFVTIIQKCPS